MAKERRKEILRQRMKQDSFFQPEGDPLMYRFLDAQTVEIQDPRSGETGVVSVRQIKDQKPNWLEQEIVQKNMPEKRGAAYKSDEKRKPKGQKPKQKKVNTEPIIHNEVERSLSL